MTEPSTTPPESPLRLPRLGGGIHWPDIAAEIERDEEARQCAAEVAAPEPAPTPSLGEAGSSLGVEDAPIRLTIPDVDLSDDEVGALRQAFEDAIANGGPPTVLMTGGEGLAEAEQIYAGLREMHGGQPYLGLALENATPEVGAAFAAMMVGSAPPGAGPPYTHVHVLDNAEDDPPAPAYTVQPNPPSRRGWWRRWGR